MTEINNCTKAGQLHESLSRDSDCNSAKPSTEFVKASQLLGKNSLTSASNSGRNSSLQSFAPASKYFDASLSKNSESSAAARDDITLSKKVSQGLLDSRVGGFCLASELLPNHDSDAAAMCEEEAVKRDFAPVSLDQEKTSRSTSPMAPDSTSEQNVVVIDLTGLTSERESKTVAGKKEPPKTKPTGRKRKIDTAVAKTKKITYFFEK